MITDFLEYMSGFNIFTMIFFFGKLVGTPKEKLITYEG